MLFTEPELELAAPDLGQRLEVVGGGGVEREQLPQQGGPGPAGQSHQC